MSMLGAQAGASNQAVANEDIEKRLAEQRAYAEREMKYRCLELAARTFGARRDTGTVVQDAGKFYEFVKT